MPTFMYRLIHIFFYLNVRRTKNTDNRKPFSLSLQPLTAFAELSYGRRDFAKTEGRKTEKGKVERVAEGEVSG